LSAIKSTDCATVRGADIAAQRAAKFTTLCQSLGAALVVTNGATQCAADWRSHVAAFGRSYFAAQFPAKRGSKRTAHLTTLVTANGGTI
jgi:hypothetical protein